MPTVKELAKLEVGTEYKEPLSEFKNVKPSPAVGITYFIPYCSADKISILDHLPTDASVTRIKVISLDDKIAKMKVVSRTRGTSCKTGGHGLVEDTLGNMCPKYDRPCNIRTKEFCPMG